MLKRSGVILLLSFSFLNVQSQDWELGKNSIKLDILQFVFSSNIELDYERYFNSGSSILLSGGYTFQGLSPELNDYERWGFTGELQFRKFMMPYQPNKHFRVYLGPFIRYKFLEYTREEVKEEWIQDSNGNGSWVNITYNSIDQFSSYYTGFVIGYSTYLGGAVELDLFVGAGVKINGRVIYPDEYGFLQTKKFGTAVNPGYAGILPRFGMKLGGLF